LLPIDPTKNSTGISVDNILSLKYSDFIRNLKVKNFEKVLIVSCEYFTRKDGTMYFSVITHELSQSGKNVTETRYDIGNPKMAAQYYDAAINAIIKRFGNSSDEIIINSTDVFFESDMSILKLNKNKKVGSVLDGLLKTPNLGKKLTKIQMRADIFSKEGLESFKDKLSQVKSVVKYKITLNDQGSYILEIYTDKKLEDIAEGFYINDLSYRIYNGEYIAFELETAGA
jgi:hypothetical protein